MRLWNRVVHSYLFMKSGFFGYVPWEIDSEMKICMQRFIEEQHLELNEGGLRRQRD